MDQLIQAWAVLAFVLAIVSVHNTGQRAEARIQARLKR